MMQLVVNQRSIDVRTMLEASRIARAARADCELQDGGETFAFVSAHGSVRDVEGKEVDL